MYLLVIELQKKLDAERELTGHLFAALQLARKNLHAENSDKEWHQIFKRIDVALSLVPADWRRS